MDFFRMIERSSNGTETTSSSSLSVNMNVNASVVRISQEETDALLAKEMNAFSMAERERVLHDIHGVLDIPTENTKQMQDKLVELEQFIQQNASSSSAYHQADELSNPYVQNRAFRMKFLRADGFDTEKAGKRMLAFFEQKLEMFGKDKLVQDITLDDLDQEDLAVLNNGHLQVLPKRDQTGRLILANVRTHERYQNPINLVR
jgi:hypothetical protein